MTFHQQLEAATVAERNALMDLPIVASALAGRVDRGQYLRFLGRAFHHVKHTPSLLMACGARLGAEREWLRRAVVHYVEEEVGHHEWILSDIDAAGGDAEAVRGGEPDFDTRLMVSYAYDTTNRANPVGLFGMIYVLEGTSVALASTLAVTLAAALDLPARAFTYLSSHGSLDRSHMRFFAETVDRLEDERDRACVEGCARDFFRLYGNVLRGIGDGVQA